MTIYRETLSLNAQFLDAIKHGNLEKLKKIVEAHPDVNLDSELAASRPILYAAQSEYWDMVIFLFEQEANLDVKVEPFKWYLAHECVVNAPLRIAKSILTYCNINSQTADGETPLMIAIKNDKSELANFMLDTDRVNLVLVDHEKNNALHYAAKYNKPELFLKIVNKSRSNILSETNKQGLFPEELLEDELFKENLAKLLEDSNLKIRTKNEAIVDKINNTVEDLPEVNMDMDFSIETVEEEKPKKISGLSSIKKKK